MSAPGGPDAGGATDSGLARQAGRGAAWAVLQSGGKHFIDLAVFLMLAKLIAPEAFGLVALAGAFIVLVNVLAEMGFGEALVQRDRLDPEHLSTAFWCTLGAGALIGAAMFACAPALARAAGRPELTTIVRAMTPLFLIQALTVVPQALMQRQFGFRALALRALAGSIVGGGLGVALAWHQADAWSLVAQQLCAGSVGLAGLWLQSAWRPSFTFSMRHARELLGFGRNVVMARALNVAASKADDLIVGLVLGPVALGFYSVACRMLLALEQLFCQGVDAVALSAFSRAGSRLGELRWLFLAATRITAALALPVFAGVMYAAPELVQAVVGPQWMPSVPILQILLVAGFMHTLMHFNHAVFKACGRPELSVRIAAMSTLLNVVTLLIAVQFGVVAVAVSYVARSVLIAPIGLWLVCRLVGLPLADYLRPLLPPFVALALGAAVAGLTRFEVVDWFVPTVTVLVSLAFGAAVYAASLAWLARSTLGTRQMLMRLRGGG
jgi:O-antigen/teichoic acid export membrane protein